MIGAPVLTADLAWRLAPVLLGPILGSFIGLVSLRLPAGAPIAAGRSACPGCGRPLGPLDLVPIISFLALGGRCRTCGTAIDRRYLALELGCLAIGLWAAVSFAGPLALVTAGLGWWLLAVAVIDAEHFWLPDVLTLPLGALGLAVGAWRQGGWPVAEALGAGLGFGLLAGLALAYRRLRGQEGLGGGDPRLLGAIGAWVGWSGLPTVLVWACLAGLSLVLAQRLTQGRLDPLRPYPFGTFLAVGAWLTWLYGPLHGLVGRGA